MRTARALAATGILTLALTGCGGGTDAGTSSSGASSPDGAEATATAVPGADDILDDLADDPAGNDVFSDEEMCAALKALDLAALMGAAPGEPVGDGAGGCKVAATDGSDAYVEAGYLEGMGADMAYGLIGEPGTTIGLGENSAYLPMTVESVDLYSAMVGMLNGEETATLTIQTSPAGRPETPTQEEMVASLAAVLDELGVAH